VFVAAWSRAGREALAVRAEQARLGREQGRLLKALGEAVYLGDEAGAERLKAQARRIGDELAECERRRERSIKLSRRQVGHERDAIRPTESFSPR
jgi:hypothetical protein